MHSLTKNLILFFAAILVTLVITLSIVNLSIGRSVFGSTTVSSQTNPLAGTTGISQTSLGASATATAGDVQVVQFSVAGNSYVFEPSTVKKGIPVQFVADMTRMPGCSKSVVIRDFGVTKTFRTGDNTVTFTPDKTGTFVVACSMNMYRGTFSVTDDGAAPTGTAAQQATQIAQQTASAPKAGGCSMGGSGGCGCGG